MEKTKLNPYGKIKISEMRTHKENKIFGHGKVCKTLRKIMNIKE
jgi:hypothetical protein